jgi:hypothetical protein
MIDLTYDLATGQVRLTAPIPLKTGSLVPVRLTFSADPGAINAIELALGSDATPPLLLAYTDDFSTENFSVWTALLDTSDARLATFMASKNTATVNAELACILDGVRQVAPNVQLTVQRAIITGPTTSSGGPTYPTTGELNSAIGTSALNPSGTAAYAGTFSATPTDAELNEFAAWVELLRSALLRP